MRELTVGSALASWTVDPAMLVLVVALAAWYLLSARRADGWPLSRTLNFVGLGLGSVLAVTVTFVGAYDGTLFWPRALQVITLLAVSPLFLANGAPFSLLLETMPNGPRRDRVKRVLDSRAVAVLTSPPAGTAALVVTPWLLYFSPLYELTLRNAAADEAVKIALVLIGLVYYWARLQVDPMPRSYPHVLSMGITFAEAMFDGALGLTIMLRHHPLAASYYEHVHRTWGPSVHRDQQIGGGLLWMVGDFAGMPFLVVLAIRMLRQDRVEAERVDRELDAEQERQVAERAAEGVVVDEPEMMRPWWETDPVLSRRYGTGGRRPPG
ncbi:cytochrome c oxidase assembly protein [Actinomadura rupiterrae]|uniref:cytochrome c oxidase assembly protein n=1 Tax=Actinomadura rupiterrae TaxID=559627 RepID=UPI0020A4C8F4|nr:cytochrome c oxidase assembly protein [Actinomadura rupiterrae]MCP2340108.1 cytochrome c oxidase assembly factor CtaG [Actinomadura rupiterrae]